MGANGLAFNGLDDTLNHPVGRHRHRLVEDLIGTRRIVSIQELQRAAKI